MGNTFAADLGEMAGFFEIDPYFVYMRHPYDESHHILVDF